MSHERGPDPEPEARAPTPTATQVRNTVGHLVRPQYDLVYDLTKETSTVPRVRFESPQRSLSASLECVVYVVYVVLALIYLYVLLRFIL